MITMKNLLEAGVHFGHKTSKWNPKMAPYLFTSRNGIHIIDLQQTVKMARLAYEALKDFTRDGERVLFVGTKRQARDAIEKTAQRCGMPYVNRRWPGGLLTNWVTIKQSIQRLKKLENLKKSGDFEVEVKTKREALELSRELQKLYRNFGGIADMHSLPEILFVVDPTLEWIAVSEARKMGIKVFGIVDSNCDPTQVNYPIAGNDDAIRAITLFLETMADAVLEGTKGIESESRFTDEDAAMDPGMMLEDVRYKGEYSETGEFIEDVPVPSSEKSKSEKKLTASQADADQNDADQNDADQNDADNERKDSKSEKLES